MNKLTKVFTLLLTPVLMTGAALSALPGFADTPDYKSAIADIKDGSGQIVSEASFSSTQSGEVRIQVKMRDFDAAASGEHGIHIHTVGSCVGPNFTSAGSHFNPTMMQHGLLNPHGHHAGDLPNIVFNANGNATYNFTTDSITLESGLPNSIFDANGSAVVIHNAADDHLTDPSGNSGPRIACGEIVDVTR